MDPLRFNLEPHLIADVRRHARIDDRLDRAVSNAYDDDLFVAQILDETDVACANRPGRRRQGKVKIDRPNADAVTHIVLIPPSVAINRPPMPGPTM